MPLERWGRLAGALALGGVSAAFATTGGNQAVAFGEEVPIRTGKWAP